MANTPGPVQLPSRDRIGRYQLQSVLGRGGMGEVYKAFDPSLDRTIALKTITAGSDSATLLDRLVREAKAAGRLSHPGIVSVYDLGEADGLVFIAMEYLEGKNLAARLDARSLTLEHKFRVLIETLDALQYAHDEGVVHRDIKPSNIHVLPNGHIKLLDFGLARVTRAESLTLTGEVMGTPHYMSPEQMKGQAMDGRTDIYSTGIVAYELFTGRRAFDGESITSIMLKVLGEPAPPMATPLSSALPELEAVILKAIAKAPEERFQAAREMSEALRGVLETKRDVLAAIEPPPLTPAHPESPTRSADSHRAAVNDRNAETIRATPPPAQSTIVAPPPSKTFVSPPGQPKPNVAGPTMIERAAPVVHDKPAGRSWLWPGLAAAVVVIATSAYAIPRWISPDPTPAPVVPAPTPAATPTPAPPPPAPVSPTQQTQVGPTTPPPQQQVQTPAVDTRTAPQTQTKVGPTQGSATTKQAATNQTPTNPTVTNPPANAAPVTPPSQPAAKPAPKSVFLATATPDPSLVAALRRALTSRGLTVVDRAAAAQWEITVKSTIGVRASGLGTSTLMTADYSADYDARPKSGDAHSGHVDGHAMEAGESVARDKALRELADKIADELISIIK